MDVGSSFQHHEDLTGTTKPMVCQLVDFSFLSYILYTFHFLSQAICITILVVDVLIFSVMLIKFKNSTDDTLLYMSMSNKIFAHIFCNAH